MLESSDLPSFALVTAVGDSDDAKSICDFLCRQGLPATQHVDDDSRDTYRVEVPTADLDRARTMLEQFYREQNSRKGKP